MAVILREIFRKVVDIRHNELYPETVPRTFSGATCRALALERLLKRVRLVGCFYFASEID
jgi:hypothetical protein